MHVKRYVSLILCVALMSSCAPSSDRPREGQTTFGDEAGKASPREDVGKGEGGPESQPAGTPTPAPQHAEAPPQPTDAAPMELPKFETPPPLLTSGHEELALPEYFVPESIRKRLLQMQPDLELPEESLEYQVFNQHLTIDVKKKTVTFTGVVRIPNKKDEAIELACTFDPAASPWICNDMFPTDVEVARQRRYQATFKCLDPYACKMEALQLWAVINGKSQPPKLFQAEGFEIRRATPEPSEIYELPQYENVIPDFKLEREVPTKKAAPAPAPKTPATPEPPKAPATATPAPATPAPTPAPAKPTPPQPPAPAPVQPPAPSAPATTPPKTAAPAPAPAPTPVPAPATTQERPKQETPPAPKTPTPKSEAPAAPAAPAKPIPPPTTSAVPAAPAPKAAPKMTSKEIEAALNDPKATLEMRAPMSMPKPKTNEYSVPGVEAIPTEMNNGVPIQAIGSHNGANSVLRNADQFAASGPGYISRNRQNKKDYGTQLTVTLIGKVFEIVERQYPNRPPFWLLNVANKTGGQLPGQASHRTGLDVDIAFPSLSSGKGSTLDKERLWHFAKQVTCAENKPVIALLIDSSVKQTMCRFVQNELKEDTRDPNSCAHRTLKSFHHWGGHTSHMHVRLRCPENSHCQNTWIPLSTGTGC